MQVFLLSPNYRNNAIQLFDLDARRASKQIVEAVQLLAFVSDSYGYNLPVNKQGKVYSVKGSHKKHVIVRWLREDSKRLVNLISYVVELSREFYKRRGKLHASSVTLVNWVEGNNIDILNLPSFSTVSWPGWFREDVNFVKTGDVFEDYKRYIIAQHKE